MRTCLIFALIISAANCFCQPPGKRFTYQQAQDEIFASNISNGTETEEYVSKDGSSIKIGSRLQAGRPSTSGRQYTYYYSGKVNVGNAMLGANYAMDANAQAEEVVVETIKLYHTKLSRKSPLYIILYVKNPTATTLGSRRTVTDYEKAFLVGEILNPNAAMTREEAISKLKESKDLLDLGVITQQKYDSLKAELTPIITGN
ncbi:MAG: hypothetical protein WDO15_09980 [Bacteroidota bacterium]